MVGAKGEHAHEWSAASRGDTEQPRQDVEPVQNSENGGLERATHISSAKGASGLRKWKS